MKRAILVVAIVASVACSTELVAPSPPVAQVAPHTLEKHGHRRVDEYFWLRERSNPAVIDYLEAENAYTEAVMAESEDLQRRLYEEIKGRIKQDDSTVPYLARGYFYYTRFEEGREYPVYCRREGSLAAEEEILLDVNLLAEGHEFCDVEGLSVSSGNDLLAYGVDTVGRRKYTIRFKDLATGEMLADEIPEVTGDLVWAEDNRTLFYTRQHPETLRAYQVLRHVVGTDRVTDVLVFEEDDETFHVDVAKTKSRRYLLIASRQTLSTEYRYLDADDPTGEFTLIQPRQRGLEYSVAHLDDSFYIRTNLEAENFRLMKAPVTNPDEDSWVEVIPHRDDVYLQDFDVFRDVLVVTERRRALTRIRILPWAGGGEYELEFDEPVYTVWLGDNHELDTSVLRFVYSSLTTPKSVYDHDVLTRERTLRKRDEVLGGFDRDEYRSERLWVPARDGVMIPVSLVYRRGVERDGSHPLLLYGYGSYGHSMEPKFSSNRLSLLDRGFVYAIAHVRGGQELGRSWYEGGKLLAKKNTFFDFIDCASFLIEEGYTSPDRLFAEGGSAGGLLVGAVANMAPELCAGIIAEVPWVDVVTTMLDDSIPLTSAEYDEWGDPKDEQYYRYMLSYSPYDQVAARAYPHMLVTTGLHDSQVQYWEPAKWVARLRAQKTDDNLLLLKTDMSSGHGGPSGRFERLRETAFTYAFILKVLELDV